MAAIINTNIQSLNAQRALSSTQNSLATSMQRLSSGMRINSAKDDAAGLAISERMSTQVRGLTVASRNANDGISLAQTAEGALSSLGNNLQRIRELAVQARNATNSAEDRAALDAEVQQLKAEVTRIAQQTSFNGTNLLDGSFTDMAFQVGANQGQTISINGIVNANVDKLGDWTSVSTPAAPVAGAAILGSGPTPQVDGYSQLSGTGLTADYSAPATPLSFLVDGQTVTLSKDYSNPATGLAAMVADIAPQLTGYTVTGDATTGRIRFTKAGELTAPAVSGLTAPSVSVTQTAGTAQIPKALTSPFTFSINGTNVSINDNATTASERLPKLIKAINEQTSATGVYASNDNGKLKLTAVGGAGNINIRPVNPLTDDDLTGETGLTRGDNLATPGSAQIGFSSLNVTTPAGADNAILAMDAALMAVSGARATLGAVQSRFETAVANLSVTTENLSSARSRIMDADFAVETANLSRSQILQQAGTAMVAQANQLPQQVLKLLQG